MDERNVRIDSLHPSFHLGKVASLDMLRLDLLHPVVSGNKWYKLRLNLAHAQRSSFRGILTFGGGYSNHLVATAYAAMIYNMPSVAVIRGRYDKLTPTLIACNEWGMELVFVSTEDYAQKTNPQWLNELAASFDNLFIIPEGGDNEWGRKGAGLINRFISSDYTHVLLSVGSGATITGLRNALHAKQRICGFAPMKRGSYLAEHIAQHLNDGQNTNWELFDEWHFGGFGKWNNELINFMNQFYYTNNIPLDIVYTGKMMFGVQELVRRGEFKQTDKLLCIHTGGLQGNLSVADALIWQR